MSLAEEEAEAGNARPEDRLLELIDERVDPERATVVRAFARAYLRRLASDGSEGISADALLAEVLGLFEFACARNGEALAVRAFNPTREQHGYEPIGSVLETNTDDLPFLVDSVSGELEARGLHVATEATLQPRGHLSHARGRGIRQHDEQVDVGALGAAPRSLRSEQHREAHVGLGAQRVAQLAQQGPVPAEIGLLTQRRLVSARAGAPPAHQSLRRCATQGSLGNLKMMGERAERVGSHGRP